MSLQSGLKKVLSSDRVRIKISYKIRQFGMFQAIKNPYQLR